MPNAIEQIYDQLMQVFGGTNPNQYFTMLMPATTLDQSNYAYDTSGTKPALVVAAESLLVDNLFDVAKVTGSNNGERLSSQYMQALSVLLPNFDPAMPSMKNALRDFINSPAPADAEVGGKPFTGNLSEYYFALYEQWLSIKSSWDSDVQTAKDTLSPEKFLEWFEVHADGQLAQIDAAMGRLLAVFSPADMQAILGALEAGPAGEVGQALTAMQDIRLPSPSGGYIYPVDLTPDDWFLDLASDADPTDLLQDPQFIALTISAKRQAIMASISQVQALIAKAPTTAQMQSAVAGLAAAQTAYSDAQNNLLQTYASNTATAVEMYLDAETGGAVSDAAAVLTEINDDVTAVSAAKGDVPQETVAKKADNTVLTKDDVKQLLEGQSNLLQAQGALLTSCQALADAGMNLASDQAQSFGDLPVMLARLQSQLSDLNSLQSQVIASANAAARRPLPSPPLSTATASAAQDVITAINNAAATAKTPNDILTAVENAVNNNVALDSIKTASVAAAAVKNATADSVQVAALAAAARLCGNPTATKALTSDRFMTLQFSFDSTTMQATSSSDTQFSQTSWGVDLFFGSASGQSSDSNSNFSQQAFNGDTKIEIAFKAAKVDVQRGWFNPGVFKLSESMSRISQRNVSISVKDLLKWPAIFNNANALSNANDTLLPSFPVAFVVAKDVSIRFQANISSLQAVQSVVDSRSAAGGGFLCFSASSSAASHSDQSRLSSRTDGTVITINMPGPQVLGWFMEFTPADGSVQLTQGIEDDKVLDIIEFVKRLKRFGEAGSNKTAASTLSASQIGLSTVVIPEDSTCNIDLGNSNGLSISSGSCTASVHIDYDRGDGVYVSAICPTSGIGNPFRVKTGTTRVVLKNDLLAENLRVGCRGAAITVTY